MISIFLAALAAQTASAEPPQLRAPPSKCVCEETSREEEETIIVFRGVVSAAEIQADETGQNPLPRQATVFSVMKYVKGEGDNPARVWHVTNPDDCGVRFDYGRQYTVRARIVETKLETDQCLMSEATSNEESPPANGG